MNQTNPDLGQEIINLQNAKGGREKGGGWGVCGSGGTGRRGKGGMGREKRSVFIKMLRKSCSS